jgi:HK97 family phage major capsid protein
MDATQIMERFGSYHKEVKSLLDAADNSRREHNARLMELEQKTAGSGGFHFGSSHRSTGEIFIQSPEFKAFSDGGARGTCRLAIEKKVITSAGNSGGSLIRPDRDEEVITLARQAPKIRDLLGQAETTSNAVQVMRESVVTNNATVVPELGLKPESNIVYELMTVGVKTIATTLPTSRQVMDDAPQLRSLIDETLRAQIEEEIDLQLLLGSGVGENILGLVPSATEFAAPFTIAGATRADILLQAIAQVELANLPATGIVLNSGDWASMMALKDSSGAYLGGGPWGIQKPRMWGLPVVATTVMPSGTFLVGNFNRAARVYDRMSTEVLISQDHADFFVFNKLMLRAESRLGMAVLRPQALVVGNFPD